MDLLYLLGALLGIGLIVLLNVVLFGRAERRLEAGAAEALLAQELPGFAARRVALARDGRGALLEGVSGGFYLVVPAGADLVSRPLSARMLTGIARDGAALALGLGDLTFPRARLLLPDEAEAQVWEERLRPLVERRPSE